MLTAGFLVAIGFTAARANDHQSLLPAKPLSSEISATALTALVRNISSSQLPSALLTGIKEDYKNYWISELYEDVEHRHSSYYITVENADQVIKLSSADSKTWTITSVVLK